MWSSVERRKLERRMACYIKSSINLFTLFSEENALVFATCMQCFMFVCEKLKTLFWLSNWIQQSIQKNASSWRKEEVNFEDLQEGYNQLSK